MRPIDADAIMWIDLNVDINKGKNKFPPFYVVFKERIDAMPAIEQKHGHWIVEDEDFNAYRCSNCNEVWCINDGTPEENGMNYCQRCGAKMNEVTE